MAARQTTQEAVPVSDSCNSLNISLFNTFLFKRVLSEQCESKSIFIEGSFRDKPGAAVVILEKEPFSVEKLPQLFTSDYDITKNFENDIYSSYLYSPQRVFNGVKTSLVFPATEKHIKKYEYQRVHVIEETAEIFTKVTLPFIQSEQFALQWLHNILSHKSESDRIVLEDPNDETGFILLPDLKWDGKSIESLYLLAFPRKLGILSLRDLTPEHLPLLKNIHDQCVKIIEEKYGVPKSRLRIYFHYQPTFYHLHLHFSYIQYAAPGTSVERAHLLSTVLNNIELLPDYYQRATLAFTVKESDNLFKKYEELKIVTKTKDD